MGEGRVAREGLMDLIFGRPDRTGYAVELGQLPDEAEDQGGVPLHGRSEGEARLASPLVAPEFDHRRLLRDFGHHFQGLARTALNIGRSPNRNRPASRTSRIGPPGSMIPHHSRRSGEPRYGSPCPCPGGYDAPDPEARQ